MISKGGTQYPSNQVNSLNLYRMASETDDGDDSIADILAASDELSRVIDRYKFAVLRGDRTDSSAKRDTALEAGMSVHFTLLSK